jgi:hypothetical protein
VKGPLVFLASLALVVALGVVMVLPALSERSELRSKLESGGAESPKRDRSLLMQAGILARELELEPGDAPALDRWLAKLPAEVGRPRPVEGSLVFELPPEAVVTLLRHLAKPVAPALESAVAERVADGRKFRVVLRFKPLVDGFTVR